MNNSFLSFSPVFSTTIVIAVTLSVFLFFSYKEFQRKQKFLALRIIALSVLALSIFGLLLRPSYPQQKESKAILLLTKGFLSHTVDSIIKKNVGLKILRTGDAAAFPNSSVLKSWYDLQDEQIAFVVGCGLPRHCLELLDHNAFQFVSSPLPKGVIKLVIPDEINVNDRGEIKGVFNSTLKEKLTLLGPGGAEDSIFLNPGKSSFTLAFVPKQSGKFTFSLVAAKSSQRIPVAVQPERHLRILFIQKFPTAEGRFLKNFLVEKKHEIVVRYQTSKGHFGYDYSNTTPVQIEGLRAHLLKSFDLLIIDQKSFAELSYTEKDDLNKSIRDGLGAIFIVNDAKENGLNKFLKVKAKRDARDTAHIHFGSDDYAMPVLPIEWQNDASAITVAKNKNRVLSGYFFSGWGKVGIQFIQETYRLGLAGKHDAYSSLWTGLISNTSRAEASPFKIKLTTSFPYYHNEPMEVAIISAGLDPSLSADSMPIVLKENALVGNYWTGRNWAGKTGWHQFQVKEDSSQLNYFVSDTSEWKSLKIADQIKANETFSTVAARDPKNEIAQVAVPALLFYLTFLFSAAFLWLAPKI